MSEAHTSRPSVSNSRGRGGNRGRGRTGTTHSSTVIQHQARGPGLGRGKGSRGRGTVMNDNIQDERPGGTREDFEANEEGRQVGSNSQVERMQRREAYTVIAPDEKKRQSIAQQAKKEEEAFKKYKEEKKVGYVSYVGTAGGGAVTQEVARQRTVNTQKQSSFNRKVASKHFRDEEKQRETQRLDKMKAEQRQKSELNQRKASERQQSLRSEHRVRNEAFLDRLQQQNQQHRAHKILSSSAAANYQEPSTSSSGTLPKGTRSEPETSAEYVLPSGADGELPLVDTLCRDFPHCDRDVLEELLLQCNGDIDQVRQMLNT